MRMIRWKKNKYTFKVQQKFLGLTLISTLQMCDDPCKSQFCTIKWNDITNYIHAKHSCQEFSLSIQILNTKFVQVWSVNWAKSCMDSLSLCSLSLWLTASISLVDSPGGLSDWSDWKVITQPFDLK